MADYGHNVKCDCWWRDEDARAHYCGLVKSHAGRCRCRCGNRPVDDHAAKPEAVVP